MISLKGIDIRDSMCYSKIMKITYKSITLPVPPGATVEWVKAQKAEMLNRMAQELENAVILKLDLQWTDKVGGRWMTVSAKVKDYDNANQ